MTILERDHTPLPPSAEEAFDWDRRGAPQVRHSHAFLARLRNLLRDEYPDVLERLFDAGVTELRFLDSLPDDFPDRSAHPGDEDLVALACRRTTFEWALRRLVTEMPAVTLRDGVALAGVRTTAGSTPTVTGFDVETADGPETLAGDLFVAAHGRRAAIPSMLAAHGIDIAEEVEDTGIIYFSRFFRLHDGVEAPGQSRPIGGDLGYLKFGLFQGDNHTFSMTLACRTDDDELRTMLRSNEGFNTAASTIVEARPWLDRATSEPITDTYVMAKLLNRRRRFLDDHGEPLVLGFAALGDAHTCTNPLYGRGCSLAFVHAALLGSALHDHPDDPVALARAFEEATDDQILPWYRAAIAQDAQSRAAGAAQAADSNGSSAPGSSDDSASAGSGDVDPGQFMQEILREGLLPAVRTDPIVLRAFLRSLNLLQAPEELFRDADVVGRVMAAYQQRGERPPEPEPGVGRDELVALLSS